MNNLEQYADEALIAQGNFVADKNIRYGTDAGALVFRGTMVIHTLPALVLLFVMMLSLIFTGLMLCILTGVHTGEALWSPNPFESYADILPGQSRDVVLSRGLNCEFDTGAQFLRSETCSLSPETGIFSRVQASIPVETGRVARLTFNVREKMLTVGQLVLLWGQPEIFVYSHVVNLRWRRWHILAIPQASEGHLSYRLPITSVVFESAS